MCNVVKACRKVCIPDEATGSGPHEVRERWLRMSRFRAIHNREGEGVKASRENVVAAGRDVAWIFPRNGSSYKPSGVKACTFRERIPVVFAKGLGPLSPFRRILVRAFTGRVGHAEARTKSRRN